MSLDIVILAAGKGTRMRSDRPKVLHELGGHPLLAHPLRTAAALNPRTVAVVVGHQADTVRAAFSTQSDITWVEQAEQLGTGHAVQLAMAALPQDGTVLVLYADVPLVNTDTLQACIQAADQDRVGLVVSQFHQPAELGRIVRDEQGQIARIVEYKDAEPSVRAICEINSGIVAAPADFLRGWLGRLKTDNAQGELYLTDIIALAVADGVSVDGIRAAEDDVTGINDRSQLARLERVYQQREAERLMAAGVTIADPARLDVRGHVTAGTDCYLDINVVLKGEVKLGRGVRIGPGAVIQDSELGDGVEVHAHTVVEGAQVARNCSLGPFARIRPGTQLADDVRIGNFVETKKATFGAGSKASHLAYLGDVSLGADCNIGAGTITCNYDGVNKHRTEIGDNVFVGTNSTLVAPVEIENDAFVAAGSVVTTRVKSGDLAVGRSRQRNIKGWIRPGQRGKQ